MDLRRLGVLGRRQREALAARDEAIRRAREAGASWRAIARATGLAHTTVKDICLREVKQRAR